ncbi:MAG: protein kinase [Anaerolineae bacterium]|nr:protein kinase [Anaerolineae bacterium]
MSNLIGQTLGQYRIIEQIGIGGMATVYKAYQPAMDRYVAIKVLPAVLSRDPSFLKRFQREAKVVAKLEHKHILPVHDYGEQEGLTYLVMRYVEAGTLKDRLAAGRLDLTETYRIIAQVGAALDYAHRLGVIHRDVKPSNVLIDSQGDAYLTDFGLARMVESSDQLTATGVGVGTPAYMAPEQGQGLKIDHRSDIYSLGVMLYEMVTGQVPYQAETPMAVVLKHITEPLPLPRQIVPDLPEEVERVILKALAKKPEDRFQTVREMVEALDLAVRAATAAPTAVWERGAIPPAPAAPAHQIRRPWNMRMMALGGGVMVAVLALVTIICGLAFALSRMQYRVQVVGGRVEVVPVGTETVALTGKPTGKVTPAATATSARMTGTPPARATSVPTATPTSKVKQEWANLRSFPAPAADPSGIVRVADGLGVVASRGRRLYRLNLEGDIVAEMDFSIACDNVAWDGESLWCAAGKTVYRVDAASGQELARFEVDLSDIKGITWDGSALWLVDTDGNLARYDRDGQRLRRLAVAVTGWPIDLAWAAGELWVADVHGNVTRLDSEFNKIGSFSLGKCGAGPFPYDVALAWDGESLWLADTGQNRILQCAPAD